MTDYVTKLDFSQLYYAMIPEFRSLDLLTIHYHSVVFDHIYLTPEVPTSSNHSVCIHESY